MGFLDLLRLPEPQGIDLDAPSCSELHRRIIQQKPFLKKVYQDWYRRLLRGVDHPGNGLIVELGSGGGFIKADWPQVATSDIIPVSGLDAVFSAEDMPFEDSSVAAFVMLNVFHHVKKPRGFFREAVRCLRKGGQVVMIEPANTPWARFIYTRFHHEAFDTEAGWELEAEGPLSDSNRRSPGSCFTAIENSSRESSPCCRFADTISIHPSAICSAAVSN